MQLILEQLGAEGLLDLALAGRGGLPAVEADVLHDLVDVLDDNVRALVLGLVEELGQGRLGLVLLLLGVAALLGLHRVAGDLEDALEELQAGDEAFLVLLANAFEAFSQLLELGVVTMLTQARDELDFDLLGLPAVCRLKDAVKKLGVKDQLAGIVLDAVHPSMLVDEFNGLGSQSVPKKLAGIIDRADGLVDLAEPAVILLVGLEAGVG